ncbi:MAG: hypothetical protein DYG98_13145 [Haliscomenobacteraceae bacterium CHB4]|nr:hypothetical protein [Saprospiraceae bacterium]MCE7923997.1 hypothetical protein [Haliscomenobacteraceae bacterium CHB4]
MTQLLLEIPRQQDLDLLLTLFKRLNIRVVQRSGDTIGPEPDDAETAFILAGLPPKQDFETYLREFEESRKDKPLPSRGN